MSESRGAAWSTRRPAAGSHFALFCRATRLGLGLFTSSSRGGLEGRWNFQWTRLCTGVRATPPPGLLHFSSLLAPAAPRQP